MKVFFSKVLAHHISIENAILLLFSIFLNYTVQAFCNPTDWALIVLIVCFINTIFYPILIKKAKFIPFVSFINGVSLCLYIYCAIFLSHINLYGLIFLIIGIGILFFIPHYLALQLLWKGFWKLSSKIGKRFFIIGILTSVILMSISGVLFQQALSDIKAFQQSNFQTLNKTFMTEKILGIGIIYHTEFCEFDGWRPPKHEPILNMGLWLNGGENPLRLDLEKRVVLYKKFFPEKQLKFDCSCAVAYSEDYHGDELWE